MSLIPGARSVEWAQKYIPPGRSNGNCSYTHMRNEGTFTLVDVFKTLIVIYKNILEQSILFLILGRFSFANQIIAFLSIVCISWNMWDISKLLLSAKIWSYGYLFLYLYVRFRYIYNIFYYVGHIETTAVKYKRGRHGNITQ